MTLGLSRTIQHVRDAARLCAICAVLLKVLSFFDVRDDTHDHAKITILLPVGPGNAQIAFRARGAHSVAQLYSSARKSPCKILVLHTNDVDPFFRVVRALAACASTTRYLYKSVVAARQRLHKHVLADVLTKSSAMQKNNTFK